MCGTRRANRPRRPHEYSMPLNYGEFIDVCNEYGEYDDGQEIWLFDRIFNIVCNVMTSNGLEENVYIRTNVLTIRLPSHEFFSVGVAISVKAQHLDNVVTTSSALREMIRADSRHNSNYCIFHSTDRFNEVIHTLLIE